MHRNMTLAGLTALLLAAPVPAQAQYAIINDVIAYTVSNMTAGQQCTFMPDKELAEARDPAPGIMGRYFTAAGSGAAKSASFKPSKKTKWTAGSTVAGMLDIDKQVDPLAVAGNSLDPAPLRFYRAGTYGTALGQWAVRGAGGGVAGVYTALFERDRGAWMLRELTVSKAEDVVEPVAPYCSKPGDTTAQRVTSAENWVTYSEKQLGKRQAKSAEADLKAKAAEAKGGAAAKELRDIASREAKKLVQSQEALVKAREAHAKAVADAEEIKRLTLPAREAEQFRQKIEEKAVNG